jgi:hypothetical protein
MLGWTPACGEIHNEIHKEHYIKHCLDTTLSIRLPESLEGQGRRQSIPRRQPTRLRREELHSLRTLHSAPNCKQKTQDERRRCGLN